jgi:hypothetical protein
VPLDTRKLVVRPQGLNRGPLLWTAAALVALVLLWVAFEVGRSRAGYSVTTSFTERRQLRGEVERLQGRVTELEAQLASAEIARRVDRESYAQVEKSLADLQARLGEQSQELAFYRGIVSPGDGTVGLRVQRLLVQPAAEPQHYRLRIVLIQAARQDAVVTGTVDVKIDGQRAGRPSSLTLAQLGRDKPLTYSFRYFQEVEAELEVPADFTPARVQIEVRPRGADAPVRASYDWQVETA